MARLKGKDEEIKGNLDQKYWVQKSDPLVLILKRQEDPDLYRSGMNCRQPVRAENGLTSQKGNDTIRL